MSSILLFEIFVIAFSVGLWLYMTKKGYKNVTRKVLMYDLQRAKKLIEDTFYVRVTTWYPPFGRKGEHVEGRDVCEKLGLEHYEQVGKVDAKFWFKDPEMYPHVNFHYWNDGQVETVKKLLCLLHEEN